MVMPAQNPKTGLPEDVEWVVRAETTPTFFLLKQHYCLLLALMVFRTLPVSKKKSGTFVKHAYADSTDFKWLDKPPHWKHYSSARLENMKNDDATV